MANKEQIDELARMILLPARTDSILESLFSARKGVPAAFCFIAQSPTPPSSRQLQDYLGISSARIAVIVRCLEKKGVIEKIPDEKDKRSSLLAITQKGLLFADQLEKNKQAMMEKLIDEIGYEKMMQAFDTINAMIAVFEKNTSSCTCRNDFLSKSNRKE